VIAGSFAFTLVEAFALAWFIGPNPSWIRALGLGLLVGGGFAASGTGINYLFTGRSFRLWLIDGGFHVARFALYAVVLAAWD
jgi:hypothetical protein